MGRPLHSIGLILHRTVPKTDPKHSLQSSVYGVLSKSHVPRAWSAKGGKFHLKLNIGLRPLANKYHELAIDAGIPRGVLNVIPGMGPDVGEPIGLHSDIDMVSFTGSTETGRRFLRYSADSNLKKVVLECVEKIRQLFWMMLKI